MNTRLKSDRDIFHDGQLESNVFRNIQNDYFEKCGIHLVYSDLNGNLIYGLPDCDRFPCETLCRKSRMNAIEEALSGGYPKAIVCKCNRPLWAVPVIFNNTILGGLIVAGFHSKPADDERPQNELLDTLLELARSYNVTNDAFLKQRQVLLQEEVSPRATTQSSDAEGSWEEYKLNMEEAIHASQLNLSFEILYSAFHNGAFNGFSLQQLKVEFLGIYTLLATKIPPDRNRNEFETIKKKVIFLIVDADDETHLKFEFLALLRRFHDALTQIIHQSADDSLSRILNYMETHLDRTIHRDSTAKAVGMSVSKLSHLLAEKLGKSFPEILNGYRADKAALLLIYTQKSIAEIAAECGFTDQSYFNKIFSKFFHKTPSEYRLDHPQRTGVN